MAQVPSGRKPGGAGGESPDAKPQKATTGRTPAVGAKPITGRTPVSGKPAIGTGRTKPVTASRRAVAAPSPAAAARTSKGFWVICRECYEEYTLDPARAQDVVTCPICEHRAQAPTQDILHQIAVYKGIENENLMKAVVALLIGLAAMAVWVVMTASPARAADSASYYVPLGAGVVGLVGAAVFGAKYEQNRWDTYF